MSKGSWKRLNWIFEDETRYVQYKKNLGDIKLNLDFPDGRRSDSLKGNLIHVEDLSYHLQSSFSIKSDKKKSTVISVLTCPTLPMFSI